MRIVGSIAMTFLAGRICGPEAQRWIVFGEIAENLRERGVPFREAYQAAALAMRGAKEEQRGPGAIYADGRHHRDAIVASYRAAIAAAKDLPREERCGREVECGGPCCLPRDHEPMPCLCSADEDGPGSCPA